MQPGGADAIRVFLVDDHPTILWGLERLIETAEPAMEVVGQASSSSELFARVPAVNPDVIVLDLDLNGESGLDCLPKLSKQSAARVLVLTGISDPLLHEKAVMQGARGVVHKREAATIILRAIEKVHRGEIWLDRNSVGRILNALARGQRADPEADKIAALTPKERHIIAMLTTEKGARNKVIADKLHMSEHTLRNHLTTIYSKLQVSGRLELYLYATGHRLSEAL
ncbi:MAG: regulatory protein [Betaproteobacteria bacterium]|nr:regulatory protein [Betaproteobacteria bacterium]